MAVITILVEELMQSMAAPVPRPPHPIRPTLTLSEPEANITPVVGIIAARVAAEEVLIKSRLERVKFVFFIVAP